MKTVELHRWRYTERGRVKTTTFVCTEADIRTEHPDAEPVPGTLERRQAPETEAERMDMIYRTASTSYKAEPR